MPSCISVLSNFIRDELPRVLYESLPEIAPVYKYIESTSMGVKQSEDIGQGWQVNHLFATGVAGLIQNANPLGTAITQTTGKQAQLITPGDSDLSPFPTASEAPHTSSLKRTLTLHKITGNFSVPVTWMQADRLGASQVEQVVRDVKAVGDLKAMVEAASFFSYTGSDGTYDVDVLGRITSVAANSVAGTYVDIVLDEAYGRISNFRVGMSIDLVADDASDQLKTGVATDGTDVLNYTGSGGTYDNVYLRLIISAIDYLAHTITVAPLIVTTGGTVAFTAATDTWAVLPKALDWIVLAGCSRYASGARPMVSWGLEDWIKSSGTLMGGASAAEALDLAYYPQFKSQVAAVNGPLTDQVLNGYIGGYLEAYPGASLDTILTTQGVTMKYLEQADLFNKRMNYDRTGKALSVKGGWDEVSYSFNGRILKWIVSPMVLKNRLYGLKFGGGNIKRYVPPRIGGSDSRIGEVEFLAPLGGHTGIFMVSRSSTGAVQELLEAPFWQYKLVAPVDVKGIKLTGITEATLI